MMSAVNSPKTLLSIIDHHKDRVLFGDLDLTFRKFSLMVKEQIELLACERGAHVRTHPAPTVFKPKEIAQWSAKLIALLETNHLVCLKAQSDPFDFPSESLAELSSGLILKTSGSTSRPKLVYHPTANITAACDRFYQFYQQSALLTWQLNLPLNHVGGLSLLFRALHFGSTVVISEERKLLHPKARAISLVPTQLAGLLESSPEQLAQLEFILIGGAPAPRGLREKALNLPISYSYGLTESFAAIAGTPLNDPQHARLFPQISGRLNEGILELKGPGLLHSLFEWSADGEYQRKIYQDQFYPTQDRALLNKDGTIEIQGRADQVIISGGEKIDLAEVEALINEHQQLEVSRVMGIPDPKWGEALALFITPHSDALASELKELLRTQLGPHFAPKFILPFHEIKHSGIKPTREDFIAATRERL